MSHLYHGKLLNNQRVRVSITSLKRAFSCEFSLKKPIPQATPSEWNEHPEVLALTRRALTECQPLIEKLSELFFF